METDVLDFHEVYDEFHEKIDRYLTRLVGESEAEDLGQEVFVKVGNNLSKFKGQSSLSTWIYKIATNAARDKFRSASYQRKNQTVSLSGASDESPEQAFGFKAFQGHGVFPLFFADRLFLAFHLGIHFFGFFDIRFDSPDLFLMNVLWTFSGRGRWNRLFFDMRRNA